ncbi:hypothetical protein GCM10009576_083950 [Streptomyces rhizosphaericus]|uniref:Tyrosinase n=1 Tax=Streptomyces rhizosphaericus TaxID=114699 RepID=A0ABN1SMY4_9ACTN
MSLTSRRRFLSLAAACTAVSATAGVAWAGNGREAASGRPGQAAGITGQFQETYKGRDIRITEPSADAPVGRLPMETVLIDGVSLHVSKKRNGFTTAVEHFRPVRSLREAARNSVDALQGAVLIPVGHHHGS